MRLFAAPADEPRARRASDVTLLVAAGFALLLVGAALVPPPALVRALAELSRAFPDFLDSVWQALVDLLAVQAIFLLVAAVWRRRLAVARDLVLSALVAVAVCLVAGRLAVGEWPSIVDALTSVDPPPWFPSLRVAVPAAVVVTASPHLVLPVRRWGRWLVGLAAVGVSVLGAATPLGAIAGILTAAVAASVVHLVFGSSGGLPGLDDVRRALDEVGVRAGELRVSVRQQAGSFLVDTTDASGDPLVVKVYGRDAHDAALLATLWRAVWYRESLAPIRVGRLHQVEHEAFVTLLAGQAGVRTDTVVTAASTERDDALLVLRRHGQLLAYGGGRLDVGTARALWRAAATMHETSIVHGRLDGEHLVQHGGEVGIVGYGGAAVGGRDAQRRADEAQILVTTVLHLGQEQALAVGMEALGADGMTAVLPYLQPAALTRMQRRELREQGVDLDDVRAGAAAAAGTDAPAIQQLRRITLGSLVRVLLPAVAVIALISGLAGLDLEELVDQVRGATWWLVILGFVVTQLPRVTQAVSTLGAAPVPLALRPVYMLQLAVSYVNLAIPTSAARIAVNIRFFQRQGIPPGAALAAGALDGFSGFVVQISLLLGLILLTPASLELDLGRTSAAAGKLLLFVVVVAVVAVAVVAVMGRVRRFVLGWARRLGTEAVQVLRGLRSFRRLGLLFGGNLATEILFASALGVFVRALGYPIGLDELLLINIGVAVLSGLVPIPGGIGVAEGGLTFGLVRAGVPEEVAFAAVLMYRLASFYLPPLWGYLALRWLERNRYL
jgi:uncharacterized protein (TIRG00374 family)